MSDEKKVSTGNVEIDVAKYTEMVLKLDEAQDKIKEMEKLSKELQIATAHPSWGWMSGSTPTI